MANDAPTRLGQINNTGLTDALFLKIYGEVQVAFRRMTAFKDRHYTRQVQSGKSVQFPLIGRSQGALLHTPGAEITGRDIPQNEKIITIDGVLYTDVSIANIDEAMNHYDVRREFTTQLGEELAIEFDKNVARTAILAARSAGWHASMPGGSGIIAANARTDSEVLIAALFQAGVVLDQNWAPEGGRSAFLLPVQYALLAQNTKLTNQWNGTGLGYNGVYADGTVLKVNNIELVKTNNLPQGNVTATITKYNVDATNTAALVTQRRAVGTAILRDIRLETEYTVRRQSTLMVATKAVGHGILRPECAVEIKVA
jgi:hypothetical protein